MQSSPISLRQQLEQIEMSSSTTLEYFLLFSGTSECNALQHFYAQGGEGAKPLWLNTPYRDWEEVMPHLVAIDPDSAFIDWLEAQQQIFPDWGLVVASPFEFDVVFSHFESLTKVIMPSGSEVFFRYWDAPQVQPLLAVCDPAEQCQLMGPLLYWASAMGLIANPGEASKEIKQWPWFQFSAVVLEQQQEMNKDVLKHNLQQYLYDHAHYLIDGMPAGLLNARLDTFVKLHPRGDKKSLHRYFSRWLG